ncbi:MAG: hypothetical protein Q8N81_02775 [bacterium]|nr:hypothetical protein [bacterium]
MITKAIVYGILAASLLLGFYFLILASVSGWNFASAQFAEFWFWVIALAIGFGIQVGLYAYLKSSIHSRHAGGKVVAASTATSTAAMISCCAHYLVNVLPVLGTSGLLSIIGQYQVQFFWVGLAFNLFGIGYVASRVIKFRRSYETS